MPARVSGSSCEGAGGSSFHQVSMLAGHSDREDSVRQCLAVTAHKWTRRKSSAETFLIPPPMSFGYWMFKNCCTRFEAEDHRKGFGTNHHIFDSVVPLW